ncbi:Acetyltransferase (GNAT) family protein [Micromonospora nigra]|uniref:Acetyltransferase (GNAT) family protein n=1 Tax=Micromonospora nigra TaxID=145857 RepID=A0A1C6RQ94_9ACTN|nr:GNAT family N-acetyltransferase [Micromonospora nigra]SCL19320.1 Acetyltransferase (GNAT) family protein [Micromonospora nigra]
MGTLRLEPMTEERYDRYREVGEEKYAEHIASSGTLPPQEAREKARADYVSLLPDGFHTAGHHFLTAYDGDDEVGILWLHLERKSDGVHAFGYDFEVREELRRRGHGRAIAEAAEVYCRERDVVAMELNVFGDNTAARALYEQLGYEPTSIKMRKRL